MAKYRLLSLMELRELKQEFIEYLVVNGIDAAEWERIKKEETANADRIIDLFSDVVFEGVMRKVNYLESRSPKEIRSFQCLEDKMILVGMKADENAEVDFTDPAFIQQAMQQPPAGIKVYHSEKNYSENRELELFQLTEAGYEVSDGKLFKAICLVLPGNT